MLRWRHFMFHALSEKKTTSDAALTAQISNSVPSRMNNTSHHNQRLRWRLHRHTKSKSYFENLNLHFIEIHHHSS